MEINRPINRRKALKVLGLGMLATCMPTLPACGNAKNEKKYIQRSHSCKQTTLMPKLLYKIMCISSLLQLFNQLEIV